MHIDLSQREAASLVIGDAIVEYSVTGEIPPRIANHLPGTAPSECYPCAGDDQWIALSIGSDDEWARLCGAMERPELTGDARFATIVGRMRNREELDTLIGEWTAGFEKAPLMATLQGHGVTAGAVFNPRELFVDPHLRDRGFWESVEDYSAGHQEYYGRPIHLSDTPYGTRLPTPQLGQHNREILGGLLGLDDAELDELEAQEVIGTAPVLTAEGGIAGRAS
jgi:crotonobetainyl-CoA:carnitine CoA-transferase CaiB-like acyl-CoA transferase